MNGVHWSDSDTGERGFIPQVSSIRDWLKYMEQFNEWREGHPDNDPICRHKPPTDLMLMFRMAEGADGVDDLLLIGRARKEIGGKGALTVEWVNQKYAELFSNGHTRELLDSMTLRQFADAVNKLPRGDAGQAAGEQQTANKSYKRTCNEVMMGILATNRESWGWTLRQWQDAIDFSKSAIGDTDAWKTKIRVLRLQEPMRSDIVASEDDKRKMKSHRSRKKKG